MTVTEPLDVRLREAILNLLERRAPNASICPSEAARAVGGDDWRALMESARDAARELARRGRVQITQRGSVLDPGGPWHGPIRIRRI